jgi:hypothetical protein
MEKGCNNRKDKKFSLARISVGNISILSDVCINKTCHASQSNSAPWRVFEFLELRFFLFAAKVKTNKSQILNH